MSINRLELVDMRSALRRGLMGICSWIWLAGYHGFPDVILATCGAHARRYWKEASQTLSKASAITYGIIETAKENAFNPRTYLQYLFEEVPNRNLTNPATWPALMPLSSQLPDHVKSRGVFDTPQRYRGLHRKVGAI